MLLRALFLDVPGTLRGLASDDDNDDVDRLTFSQVEAGGEPIADAGFQCVEEDALLDVNCPTQMLFQDDDAPVSFGSSKKNRRSWGVVVNSLAPSTVSPQIESLSVSSAGPSDLVHSPLKDRASPPKKKRCRKSTTPSKSSSKAVSFGESTEQEVAATENQAPLENATLPMKGPPSQPAKPSRVSGGGGGRGAMATNTLLATLTAPTNLSLQQDEAVNAFDRLLASTSTMVAAPVPKRDQEKKGGSAASQGSRTGKRGASQQTNSLMNLF